MAGYFLRQRESASLPSCCLQRDDGNHVRPKRKNVEEKVHDPIPQEVVSRNSAQAPPELTPLQLRALQIFQQSVPASVRRNRKVTRSTTVASRGALRTSPVLPNAQALVIEGEDLEDDDHHESVNEDVNMSVAPLSSRNSPLFHIGLSSKELKNLSKGLGLRGVMNESILGEAMPPPVQRVTPKDKLHPLTPSVFVENENVALSPPLLEFCLLHQIAVMRGLASALDLDLGVFSTKTLVEVDPEHPVEIREHRFQSPEENYDASRRKGWKCCSLRSKSTIQEFAKYQAHGFQNFFENAPNQRKGKILKFATNVDLSDEEKWKEQLMELKKLPPFCRVNSPGNMLCHIGHDVLGMNTVQVFMKVPGSRTPGHQENNNFCSISINIGPGDTEWFATPEEYWGAIKNMCELNNVNYLHDSWWPDLKDCEKAGIPVYRFNQKPGDVVWVNSGCVHWVQAIGWCNNIAWNVGPLTARQYRLGIERYEWNKSQRYRSSVPMVHLSWNLARNIKFAGHNRELFELIRNTLMRTLVQCFKLLEFARSKNIEVRFHVRQEGDTSHYCGQCQVEVFNLLFIRDKVRSKGVVHCIDCALKVSSNLGGFVCFEEYKLEDLMKVYDNFAPLQPLP